MRFTLASTTYALLLSAITTSAMAAPVFNLSFIPGTNVQAQAGFTAAANMWSSVFNDNATINLTVGTGALGNGILASAKPALIRTSYTNFRNLLTNDQTSSTDNTVIANLSNTPNFSLITNYTSNNPSGAGSAAAYLDTDSSPQNTNIVLTNANLRALGVNLPNVGINGLCAVCDGYIQFGTAWNWDYTHDNGIDANAFDFVGIAAHEIGHALGFISGVDALDYNSTGQYSGDQFYLNPLDLFRYSSTSAAYGAVDFTAGTSLGAKYFSIDGGTTAEAFFSTGQRRGDGRQASHWKDNLGLGIMDPTTGYGEYQTIGSNDLRAFDAIGWNVVPEPGSMALVGCGLAALIGLRSRKTTA